MKTYTKIQIAKFISSTLRFLRFKKKIFVKRKLINWCLDLSEGIDLSIFLFGSFQANVTDSIYKNIIVSKVKKKQLVNIIDVGSNVGDKSLTLANKLINKKILNFKIFSIEPTDYAFKKQMININLNPSLKKKIFPSKFFISYKKKTPKKVYSSWKLDTKKRAHKIHRGFLMNIDKKTKSISMDEFIKKNNISDKLIIKIDVDGFEMGVLKSLTKTLKRRSPIIYMEYAPYALMENDSSVEELQRFLKKYKLKIYDLSFKRLNSLSISEGSSIDIILAKNMPT